MPAEFMRQYEIFFKKAHGDLKAAEVLFSTEDSEIDLSVIMFHLQQAAENS